MICFEKILSSFSAESPNGDSAEKEDGEEESSYHDVLSATLGIVGGVAEIAGGVVAEWLSGGAATPLAATLFVDGLARIVGNSSRFVGYCSGNKKFADAMPSSIGATIGKAVDMASGMSFYGYGKGQAIGGGINDVLSFTATGGSGGALSELMTEPTLRTWSIYTTIYPVYSLGIWDDFKPLDKK